MRCLPFLLICTLLGACASASAVPIPAKRIKGPSARLMEPVQPLAPVKEGDSLYAALATCRAEYGRVAMTVKGLQDYSRIVSGGAKP